jgi:hypothetical protein
MLSDHNQKLAPAQFEAAGGRGTERRNLPMQAKRSDPAVAERAVALQVLRDDHPERWSRSELERTVSDIEPPAIDDALEHLAAAGVVVLDGESIGASGCAKRMDALGLIAV